jgi:protease-4
LKIGLVDKIGGLQDAINTAAKMAKLNQYSLREYPEQVSFFQKILGGYKEDMKQEAIKEELGVHGMKTYKTVQRVMDMMNVSQARMPFEITIH